MFIIICNKNCADVQRSHFVDQKSRTSRYVSRFCWIFTLFSLFSPFSIDAFVVYLLMMALEMICRIWIVVGCQSDDFVRGFHSFITKRCLFENFTDLELY